MADKETARRPRIYREPQIPTSSHYEKVAQIRAIIDDLEQGYLYGATRLIRQMWHNPRLRVAVSTRLAGLSAAEERWRPAREDRDGRAAKIAIEQDWPKIISTATRDQANRWGLLLGLNFSQPHWYRDRYAGREINRIEVYDPSAARWDDLRWTYVIRTRDSGLIDVPSPSVSSPDDLSTNFIVHEPFGKRSHLEGYVVSAWYPWLGNNLTSRDRLRSSEKVGDGNLIAEIPHGASVKAADDFARGLKNMKGGAVIPAEVGVPSKGPGQPANFGVKPLEWNAGNGYQVVDSATAATAVDLIILFLGGNLQTEVKGGGSYAAIDGQMRVTAGYIDKDAKAETHTLYHQAVRRWAERNYGDPDLAPYRDVVANPPETDKASAQILSLVSASIANIRRDAPEVDVRALLDRYRIPLLAEGKVQVTVPAQPSDNAAQSDTSNVKPDAAPALNGNAAMTELTLTPTDIAAITSVDEGRASIGLEPEGGEVGDRWIIEHTAKVKAEAAPAIAEAAQAEQGNAQPSNANAPAAAPAQENA